MRASTLRAVWNAVRDYGWRVLIILAAAALSGESILLSVPSQRVEWLHSFPGIVFLVCLIVGIIGGILDIRRTARVTTLERDLVHSQQAEERYKDDLKRWQEDVKLILEGQLSILADSLGFGDTERISVYRFDPGSRRFHMLGRYSKSPPYREAGRGEYPADQGCIGMAWNNGRAFIDHLPNPTTHFDDYCHEMASRWHIPQTTVQGFKMKSRSYAAYAIDNAMGDQRIAVIVFESTRTGFLDRDTPWDALQAHGKGLIYFLDRMRPLDPDLVRARISDASKGGY